MAALGGLAAAAGSAVCNGSFGTISKLRPVERAQIPAPVFSFWTCAGIVLSSLLFLVATPRGLTAWGLLSGLAFTLSMACTFPAIRRLGLGSAAGVWSGTAMVVSFTWAVKVQGERIESPALAAPGLVLLVLGVFGIAVNGQAAAAHEQRQDAEAQLIAAEAARSSDPEGAEREHPPPSPAPGYPLGLAFAILAGLFGGLVLAPMGYAPGAARGLQFIPSMGLGVLLAAPLVTAASLAAARGPWRLRTQQAALPGIASGAVWNAGNALSILATTNPDVGLAVAYPIMQAGLFVAGLWGILLFGELREVRHQVTYWLAGVVLVVGATMLAVSKQ